MNGANVKNPEDKTTILVTVEAREELKKCGVKGESYASIILRLIENYKLEGGNE